MRSPTKRAGDLAALARDTVESWPDGRVKLLVATRALACRRISPDLFAEGAYLPLRGGGAHTDRLFALARRHRTPVRIRDILWAGKRPFVSIPLLPTPTAEEHHAFVDIARPLVEDQRRTLQHTFGSHRALLVRVKGFIR